MKRIIDHLKRHVFFRKRYVKEVLEMSNEDIKTLKNYARKEGLTLSQFVEKVIKKGIDKHNIQEYWRES